MFSLCSVLSLFLRVALPCLVMSFALPLALFWILPNAEFCWILSKPDLTSRSHYVLTTVSCGPRRQAAHLSLPPPPLLFSVQSDRSASFPLPPPCSLTKSCSFPAVAVLLLVGKPWVLMARYSCQLWGFPSCLLSG